jgi:hypothetical protein
MRELVDHGDFRLPPRDGTDVHFLEHDASILDSLSRYNFELANLRFGLWAPVGLDESNHDVDAATPKIIGLGEHAVRLTDPCRRSDVELEFAALTLADEREKLGRLSARLASCSTTVDRGASQVRLVPRRDLR